MAVSTEQEASYLRRALDLAEGGRGRVSPNPLAGAVIVRDGGVVGEGFHAELGGLHAERAARPAHQGAVNEQVAAGLCGHSSDVTH